MFLNCPHCKKDMEPAVLTDTLEDKQATNKTKAICVECMKELSLSIYTLKMLVNLKQFYSKPKSGAAFSFFCKTCNKNLQAILSPDKTKAICPICSKDFEANSYAIRAMDIFKIGKKVDI